MKIYVNENGYELEVGDKVIQVRQDGEYITSWDVEAPLFKFTDEKTPKQKWMDHVKRNLGRLPWDDDDDRLT